MTMQAIQTRFIGTTNTRGARIDLHSHKALTFESADKARRYAHAHYLDTAFAHARASGEWILVFFHDSLGCMCAVLPGGMCCTMPDW